MLYANKDMTFLEPRASERSSDSIDIESATAFPNSQKLENASKVSGLFIAVAEARVFPGIQLINDKIILVMGGDLSIFQIINSGQCFRNRTICRNRWEIWYLNVKLEIHLVDNVYLFDCSLSDFENIWFNYFDFGLNYSNIKNKILEGNDKFLCNAVKCGYGLRILRQDFWEMVVTFIISQRNNIPKIKNTIARICNYFGGKFPSPKELFECSEKDIKSFGLGYRDRYIVSVSEKFYFEPELLEELPTLKYEDLLKFLMTLNGVGEKVANCIALFGAYKIEAFPIDVWIKRILDTHYPNGFDLSKYDKWAGIVQQYMYFYQRFLDNKQTNF